MIHFVVSSPAAAQPVIDRYGLSERGGGAFPLYVNGETTLTVSGPGKMATAAAAAWLFQAAGGVVDGAWLHLGPAGHSEADIGTGLLAHKVVDRGSGRAWYPAILMENPAPSGVVVTVDRIDPEYDEGLLFDVDAAGFFTAAERFATVELVHAYRIVADNHGATLGDNFSDDVVEDLVASKIGVIDGWVEELRELSAVARQGRGSAAPGDGE